jgi:hypothetical protein
MAAITTKLQMNPQQFAVGANVGAYLRSQWSGGILNGAPNGAAIETIAVAADYSLTYLTLGNDALPDGTGPAEYVAYIGTPDRYVRFMAVKKAAATK